MRCAGGTSYIVRLRAGIILPDYLSLHDGIYEKDQKVFSKRLTSVIPLHILQEKCVSSTCVFVKHTQTQTHQAHTTTYQRWIYVGPTSKTLDQHRASGGPLFRARWGILFATRVVYRSILTDNNSGEIILFFIISMGGTSTQMWTPSH